MEIIIKVTNIVEVDSYSTFIQMEAGIESRRSNKERINDLGKDGSSCKGMLIMCYQLDSWLYSYISHL